MKKSYLAITGSLMLIYHGISKPTYVKDRYQRYLDWYAKYIPR